MEEQFDLRTESSEDKAQYQKRRDLWLKQPRYDHDRFSDFMFGARHNRKGNIERQNQPQQNQNQTYIDYEQLMISIDSLVESTKNLKPLFLKLFPFLDKIWKKK